MHVIKSNLVALILGGGQGKRLFPLTMYRSKPAVPIGGKYRLIDIPVSNCLHSNIKNIYVLTQFNSESLNNHVNSTYRFDYFSRAFVRILAAEQTSTNGNWFQGTADAVRRNLAHLNLSGAEDVLILSGDHLYKMDYSVLYDFHKKTNADFTVSAIPITKKETREFGILKVNSDGRITAFKEKPANDNELKGYKFCRNVSVVGSHSPCSYLASMGVYIFKAKALLAALNGKATDFGKEIIPNSIGKMKGFAFLFNDYWKDVGTIESFYEVNIGLALQKPYFSFFYDGLVFSRPRFLPPARIIGGSISRSIISEGSAINKAEIESSIIGLRSIVGKGCRITRTVMMGADYFEPISSPEAIRVGIGDGTCIDKAIVDKNARIGRNVTICNSRKLRNYDGENYFIRDGIVIIPKSARIADGTKI